MGRKMPLCIFHIWRTTQLPRPVSVWSWNSTLTLCQKGRKSPGIFSNWEFQPVLLSVSRPQEISVKSVRSCYYCVRRHRDNSCQVFVAKYIWFMHYVSYHAIMHNLINGKLSGVDHNIVPQSMQKCNRY